MLAVLQNIEKDLPEMLRDGSGWQSLMIDYHPPFVERLWRQHGEYRAMLHRIHPCDVDEALLHAHPWPSAVRVVSGLYEMGIGFSTDQAPKQLAATVHLPSGSAYEMVEKDGWHSVRPINVPSLSVMVIGKPWSDHKGPQSTKELRALTDVKKDELLSLFKTHYR
ncbi:MAG: hypothetical protein AAGA35_04095 [Patescibacteria group bacterium]